MNIIGINAFHGDSSACLLVDGRMLAAAEEERFRRIKHWAGFPGMAIAYCLQAGNLKLADIDVVAINTDPKAARIKKLQYALSGRASAALIREKISVRNQRQGIPEHLQNAFPDDSFAGAIEYVEHHLAHLASAYSVSPYSKASIISIDGFGDFASAAWGLGTGADIDLQKRIYFPHSLGIFYQALTQFLGFPNYGDEYKVMGLAPYGEPNLRAQMDRLVIAQGDGNFTLGLDYFLHHKQPIGYQWENGEPRVSRLFSDKLSELLGPARLPAEPLTKVHFDIARSVQDAYERTMFHMLRHMHQQHRVDQLTIAGGCGMNSVANGKIHLHTPYREVYVQSAAGDAGGAIGAAVIAAQRHGNRADFVMNHSYWGSSYSNAELKQVIDDNIADLGSADCGIDYLEDLDKLTDRVSDYIIDGRVVGWFQGAMEWGPRALGNRSILCDPRRQDMQDILNSKIKRRESFRPFAPSVLRESVADWFESDADVPFMMKVFQIKTAQRDRIPAVTHVDGSGRLQTVTRESNPLYYQLIRSFFLKTDVPMLLNTSFNENEPVVRTGEEAMACFLRTNMDILVLGNYVISRPLQTTQHSPVTDVQAGQPAGR